MTSVQPTTAALPSSFRPTFVPGEAPRSITAPVAKPGWASPKPPEPLWWPSCWRCGRTLAEFLTPPYSLRCHRCKAPNQVPVEGSPLPQASTN